ncbi:sperm axonemal maintenance protein CFAP97D1 [Genypterus blacodes]|uniref:sperm axonemal maintenance protein CFAP97D1 n=1 Tax=Genypterus blacodes TaxID=154954 RepID=UPI003F75CD74
MQHLAYQPVLPSVSKYLQQKWDNTSYEMHRRKVKSVKATINTTPPRTYSHLTVKLGKQKLEEDNRLKISRENDMLLGKISHIMNTTGRVDNRNIFDRKSLSREKRQRELLRISQENQVILCRLSQCRPNYNLKSWHEDWLQTLKVMDSIARYPRGRASEEKGQERSDMRNSDCDNGGKIYADATVHSPNNKTIKAAAGPETKNKYKKEGPAVLLTPKVPRVHRKSTLPDIHKNPSTSNATDMTPDRYDNSPPKPELHTHDDTHTQQETTSIEEG